MILTDRNCPVLKYLRWRSPLFSHPDFRDMRIPLYSEYARNIARNMFREGFRVDAIYDMTRLGAHGFLRPYTTQMSEEMMRHMARTGQKPSELTDLYVDMHPLDGGPDEPFADGEHSNTTDYSDILMDFNKGWTGYSERFSERIDIVSEKFWDAMRSSRNAFLKESILRFLVGERLRGTVIVPKQSGLSFMYDFVTTDVRISDGGGRTDVGIDGVLILLHDYSKVKVMVGEKYTYVDQSYLSGGERKEKVVVDAWYCVALYELFKRYAGVETREAKSLRQHRDSLEVKTQTPGVNYIDCSWFTTVVRTEGFKVRGHFRMQPYGPGNALHKLIYIDEFEKHGYTRKAKCLAAGPETEQ